MNRGTVPDYQQITRDMLEKVLQELHHVRAFEGFSLNLNIESALFRNPADDRKVFMTQFVA
jgi:hypothetical protein